MTPTLDDMAARSRGRSGGVAFLRVAAFVAAYFLAAKLARLSQAGPESLTAMWPASGLVLAVLSLADSRRWPMWLSVTWLTNLAQAHFDSGVPWLVGVGYSTTDVCEGALAAWLLVRTVGTPVTLGRLKEVIALVGVAAIGSNAITGLMGAAVTVAWLDVPFWRTWFTWCLSNGVGMLQVAPLILAWRDGLRQSRSLGWAGFVESGVLLATLAGVGAMAFTGGTEAGRWEGPLPYVTFPWLMWAALRTSPFVATIASVIVSALAVGCTVNGIGPFAQASTSVARQILGVQLFVTIAVLSTLIPAAVVAERRRAEQQVRRMNRLYALLSETSQAIVRVKDRASMLAEVCRIATETGPFRLAWVGRLSPAGDALEVEAVHGPGSAYLSRVVLLIDVIPERRGPMGSAARDGRVVVANDLREMDGDTDWRKEALAAGFRAGASVPLRVGGRVWGVFGLYAAEPGFFDPDEATLLEELGAAISFGLDAMEREAMRLAAQDASASLERQLRQAQKMEAVGRLAGGIAHDFNNLLQVIKGFADLAVDGLPETDPSFQPLEEIRKAANRAKELTGHLLLFSRKQVAAPIVMDLNHAIGEMQSMLRRVIGEDVEIVTVIDENLGTVKADPGQIEQVVINLAVNARDAMPRGGILTIQTADVAFDDADPRRPPDLQPGRYAMILVRDNGSGMSETVQALVFEPFFTTKPRGKGTGLGLAMVYGVVRQSGGHITFTSQVGVGTTFEIYLPIVENAGEDFKSQINGHRSVRGSETVLVVEDEEQVRTLARRILERLGYTVLDASGGDQAIALATSYRAPIHLLLTDVIMPGQTGPEVARLVKTVRPAIKLLYMSGYTDDALSPHGVLEGGQVLVQKPFSADVLSMKVRQVLESVADGIGH